LANEEESIWATDFDVISVTAKFRCDFLAASVRIKRRKSFRASPDVDGTKT